MIQNQWYIGCASSLLSDKPVPARIGPKKIVLFRDDKGRASALLDRCCHRGFPLSKGAVKEGRLQCGFHGWQYNGAGQCVRVPSQSADKPIPTNLCVMSFPCAEKNGFIWVWVGQEKPAELEGIPEADSGNWIQGAREIKCNYMRALEITFDSPHVYFAHPSHPATVAANKFGTTQGRYGLRATNKGCILFGPVEDAAAEIPALAFTMEFRVPGSIRFEMPTGKTSSYMFFFVTPLTETTCRFDWLLTSWAPEANQERLLWVGEGRDIIDEDQVILEAIQIAYDEEGEVFERSVESDTPTLTLRRIMKLAEAGEWDLKKYPGPQSRVISLPGPTRFEF
ncbi:MAG: Rieske 2Fe-2S domain-containing protein [Bdellovibrionota bacterium]